MPPDRPLHVSVLSLDAVSRARFTRDMPLSNAFLRELNRRSRGSSSSSTDTDENSASEFDSMHADAGEHALKVRHLKRSTCFTLNEFKLFSVSHTLIVFSDFWLSRLQFHSSSCDRLFNNRSSHYNAQWTSVHRTAQVYCFYRLACSSCFAVFVLFVFLLFVPRLILEVFL